MKPSLRDLFWLTLVCALGVAWALEIRARTILQSRLEDSGHFVVGGHFTPQVWRTGE